MSGDMSTKKCYIIVTVQLHGCSSTTGCLMALIIIKTHMTNCIHVAGNTIWALIPFIVTW